MERIKNMSLKKALFTITILFLLTATVLSALTLICCIRLNNGIYNSIQFEINNNGMTTTNADIENIGQGNNWSVQIISVLQIGLPVLFYITALLLAAMVFYRLKLKMPLAILQDGAERIRRQDLDFTIEKCADDELGTLCAAFETMRFELLKSNRELWRQMEERKRLNAAFSHDLRNPVTVLKGSAANLLKGLEKGTFTEENAGETISLITQYAGRIENYVEAMTNAQKLEDLKFNPQSVNWSVLVKELENSLTILSTTAGKEIQFLCNGADKNIKVDRYIIHNTAENLVSNALRYTKDKISINLSCNSEKITISVSDNGSGFSDTILSKGAIPFLRDNNSEQGTHFGMGLYVCRLLCEKHGGSLALENHSDGAKSTATFYF